MFDLLSSQSKTVPAFGAWLVLNECELNEQRQTDGDYSEMQSGDVSRELCVIQGVRTLSYQ